MAQLPQIFRKTSPKSTKICDFGEVLRKLGLASVAGLWYGRDASRPPKSLCINRLM